MNEYDEVVAVDEVTPDTHITTPMELVFRRFVKNKLAIIGFFVLVAMTLIVIIGPMLSPYGEYTMFYVRDGEVSNIPYPDSTIHKLAPPTSDHWLGTDSDGRDVLTRLLYGGRVSLIIGFVCVAIQMVLGILMGGIAGYFGGWVDMLIMRIVEIFFCIPTLPVALIIISIAHTMSIPQQMQIYILMAVIGFLGWAGTARFVRGQILSLREQEFMLAAEATGIKVSNRILKHLIPNVTPQLIVSATLSLGSIILFEASLSFLGLGVPYPYASWGNMVNIINNPIILRNNINIWIPPGLCIMLIVTSFNFIGDGLRDAFDPKVSK